MGSTRAASFVAGVAQRGRLLPRRAVARRGPRAALEPATDAAESWETVVSSDWQFIKQTHQQVVQVLNPEEREMSALQSRMQQLSAELSTAHARVHSSEAALTTTLEEVRKLESVMASIQASSAIAPSSNSSSSNKSTTATSAAATATAPVTAAPAAPKRVSRLHSSLNLEEELKQFWYPVEFSAKLVENMMVPIELFDEQWVVFRGADGQPACLRDECAHRACPLSLGTVDAGRITCAYHGWSFEGDGQCSHMPSTPQCKGVGVTALQTVEQDGMVFVWTGQGEHSVPTIAVPDLAPPKGYTIHSEITLEVPVEHGLLIENLLDLAHAPFTHTATFARGWPVPDAVKFHLREVLGGNWDPYPIDMSFLPPVMTFSTIGLNQPGKIERGVRCEDCEKHLHQLHVCLPARPGHTRLLYRMSLDFMGWVKFIPGIQKVWTMVANQVLAEDLVLVLGQQARMQRGGDTWNFPVPYDKLAVRYRGWRNNLEVEQSAADRGALVTMSAGEMFAQEDDDGCQTDWDQEDTEEARTFRR